MPDSVPQAQVDQQVSECVQTRIYIEIQEQENIVSEDNGWQVGPQLRGKMEIADLSQSRSSKNAFGGQVMGQMCRT